MLPSIAFVESVEMIRDGGSLAAVIHDPHGSQYWLFLQIRMGHLPTGEIERLGYASPVVVDRLTGRAVPMSWQHAAVFLKQIGRLIERESDLTWFGAMQEVVATNGSLPAGIEKLMGIPRSFNDE